MELPVSRLYFIDFLLSPVHLLANCYIYIVALQGLSQNRIDYEISLFFHSL